MFLPSEIQEIIQIGAIKFDIDANLKKFIDNIFPKINKDLVVNTYFTLNFKEFEIQDCHVVKSDEEYNVEIFIQDFNWELEDQIYNRYAELLEEQPNLNFVLHINHTSGRTPRELITLM